MIWVTEATHVADFRLRLRFNDGIEGEVDLRETIFSDHREPIIQLKDPEKFRRFRVDMDTVVWENGADLAPEYLYELSVSSARREPAAGAKS